MSEKLQARLGDPSCTLYLLDISSFIFRAFFAIRSLSNRRGEPTNAVYGVATMLARLVDEAKPEYLAIAYDSKEGPSFREEIYEDYKANRSAAPDDLIPQFDRIEQLITCLGMPAFRQNGVEADDLIATLTREWCKLSPKHRVVVVTGDKDLMQLVDDRVQVWDTMKNEIYASDGVVAKFGVRPDQIRDYLALVGDSSDNIPGVPSIGPKSAVDLLKEHGDLESILKAAEQGLIKGKKGEVIQAHREDARLSARLASLRYDVPLKFDTDTLKYRFHMGDACVELLKDLDFHTLVTKWAPYASGSLAPKAEREPKEESEQAPHRVAEEPARAEAPAARPPQAAPVESIPPREDRFRTIQTEAQFQELLECIEKKKEFGFDLETTSLNPRQAELVGVAICYDREFGCYIPVGHRGTHAEQLPEKRVLEGLRPYLENPKYKKIGQNLKYDWSVLAELGIQADGIGADTMIAAYVLEPDSRHSLQALAAAHLDYTVMTYEEVCGKGKDQLGFDQVPVDVATRYSAEDAWIAVRLWEVLKPRLQQEGLMRVFCEVDLPLVLVLSKMERQGVCIDEDWLRQLSREFEKELSSIESRIGAYTQGPINLNSPKQLGKLLFEDLKLPPQGKTKTGYSTDAQVLDALSPLHEVPRLLLEYREISKLKGTYVDSLPGMRDPKTGKIHAGFHQTVAATGRLSSSDPNLQNIPVKTERGRKVRKAFVPQKGSVLLSADYSQIELRLLAHMSGDPELVRSFQRDEDVHRRTASEIFDVPPEKVDDRQRGIAKAINFGLMYGKSAFGLAQELKIGRREAQDIISRYFVRYNGVKRFLDQQILDAKEKGYAETLMGRKRYLPDIQSRNPAVRANAERMAMNAPIQGTAADLMKIAMLNLDQELDQGGYRSKLIIQVHDELLLDCPKDEAEKAQKLVCQVMENAMKLSVPLRVNTSCGDNWMDL